MHCAVSRVVALEVQQGPGHNPQAPIIIKGEDKHLGCSGHVEGAYGPKAQAHAFDGCQYCPGWEP